MSNNINALQDRLDGLAEDIRSDAELILEQVDIDALLEDPETTIHDIVTGFIEQHEEEILRGLKLGRQYARKIVRQTG